MTAIHFSTRAPAHETIEFCVTNAPARPTDGKHRIVSAVAFCGRLLLVMLVSLSVVARWSGWSFSWRNHDSIADSASFISRPFRAATETAMQFLTQTIMIQSWPWICHLGLSAVLFWVAAYRQYIYESILVVPGIGVQIISSSSNYLLSPSVRLIPSTRIQDIFLHEAFRGFEVRYYLCIVVENESKVVVVFPKLLPRFAIVEEVWRKTRESLYLLNANMDVDGAEDQAPKQRVDF